jgi:predicted HicB family RNase H-like nuclease
MMQYKGYLSRVDFDDEANIFHGEVINIRDVVTFQGETVNELHRAFEDSVEDYLAFCAERGEEPNPPFSGRFTLSLSPEQHRKVVLAAEKAGKGVDRRRVLHRRELSCGRQVSSTSVSSG